MDMPSWDVCAMSKLTELLQQAVYSLQTIFKSIIHRMVRTKRFNKSFMKIISCFVVGVLLFSFSSFILIVVHIVSISRNGNKCTCCHQNIWDLLFIKQYAHTRDFHCYILYICLAWRTDSETKCCLRPSRWNSVLFQQQQNVEVSSLCSDCNNSASSHTHCACNILIMISFWCERTGIEIHSSLTITSGHTWEKVHLILLAKGIALLRRHE